MYLAFKNVKVVNSVNSGHRCKAEVWMMFVEVKMQQDKCRSYNYKLNCKKPKKERI